MAAMMKILFVGDRATGKSRAVTILKGNTPSSRYLSTVGAEVHPYSNKNNILMNIWDVGGDPKYCPAPEKYFENTTICVLFGPNANAWQTRVSEQCANTIFIVYKDPETLKEQLDEVV
jgi:GTPase SAR1 family protein